MVESDSRDRIIADELRLLVNAGSPGDAMPSTRALVARFSASPVTVARAMSHLVAAGVVRTEPGRGSYIAERSPASSPDFGWQAAALRQPRVESRRTAFIAPTTREDVIPLTSGYLAAELQPRSALQAATARTGRRAEIWDSAPAEGIPELRRIFAASVGADPSDAFVVPAAQAGLATLLRTLADPGESVLIENPSYPGALAAAQAAALVAVPVPGDELGVDPALLDECFARTGAKVFYLQPTFANPTGVVTSAERRRLILAIAQSHGAFVIEDDWARHLGFAATTPRALITGDPDGRVVYLTSLSKPSAPSMRIGVVIARGPARDRIRNMRIADELFVARPLQETAVELLESPAWRRHLRTLGPVLLDRRDALRRNLASHAPGLRITSVVSGGFHLWVELPIGVISTAFAAAALAEGVLVGDGADFFANEPTGNFLRLSFTGASEPQLAEGVRRLGRLLR